jgi:hypothetical protein
VEAPRNETTTRVQEHEAVFGGCDFATIQADISPQTNFRRPGEQPLSRPLFLIVQPPCEAGSAPVPEIVRAVAVVDRTIVVPLSGFEAPIKIIGRAMVMRLPRLDSLKAGSEMQIVVFRERLPSWITHPVRLVS